MQDERLEKECRIGKFTVRAFTLSNSQQGAGLCKPNPDLDVTSLLYTSLNTNETGCSIIKLGLQMSHVSKQTRHNCGLQCLLYVGPKVQEAASDEVASCREASCRFKKGINDGPMYSHT